MSETFCATLARERENVSSKERLKFCEMIKQFIKLFSHFRSFDSIILAYIGKI